MNFVTDTTLLRVLYAITEAMHTGDDASVQHHITDLETRITERREAMATITPEDINHVRQQTGCGVYGARNALIAAQNDLDQAISIARAQR